MASGRLDLPETMSTTQERVSSSKRTILQGVYDDLVFYFKYASSAYSLVCPRPNGNHMVLQFNNTVSDIQGFVARDDKRKELVIALRGSASIADFVMDAQVLLVPFVSPGVSVPSSTRVHGGFLISWNSVAVQVIAIIEEQLILYPDYSLVVSGHSLGGSLAVLAAVSLRQNFPDRPTRLYSYGAPRTGNKVFANFVNVDIGDQAYRVVHGNDGVPTMIPAAWGYHHHGVEYWQNMHPPSAETTVQCSRDGEDPTCSASVPSGGINAAHMTYFGILSTTPFCL